MCRPVGATRSYRLFHRSQRWESRNSINVISAVIGFQRDFFATRNVTTGRNVAMLTTTTVIRGIFALALCGVIGGCDNQEAAMEPKVDIAAREAEILGKPQ